jgi:hypothetical protein
MTASLNACQSVFERAPFSASFKSSAVNLSMNCMFIAKTIDLPALNGCAWENAGTVLVKPWCAENPVLDNTHCLGRIGVCLRVQVQKPSGNPRGHPSRQREAQNH